jgi:glycoprotein-N-acetylgalactosamine 3-beta-galactosyltransferase
MAGKALEALKLAYRAYGIDHHWFLLVDDDTYVFVDNARKFISNRSHTEPLTYGYNFKIVLKTGYHSGGGGVLFTHESMKRIVGNIENGKCNEVAGFGDIAIGVCAEKSNVSMGNSLDEFGRERFHPLGLKTHLNVKVPGWLFSYSSNVPKGGKECCSEESITFHYVSADEMISFSKIIDESKLGDFYNIY